jgi:hypothetical protein
MARTDIPLRMYTDSKQIAYGINYGLKEWPKHDFNANMKPALWAQIVSLMAYRADLGQIITVDYEQKQNAAYMQTTTCCHAQSNGKIEYPKFAIARAQCITWILCANRLGFHRDVKRVIAKLVWGNRYRITIPYLSKDQF